MIESQPFVQSSKEPNLSSPLETEHYTSDPLPEIISAVDFLSRQIEPPPILVAGLIHKGTLTSFSSNAKARKTWILLDLALSVAGGTDFWGRKTEEGKALFINFEIIPFFFQERINKLALKKELATPAGLDVWNLRGFAANITELGPMIIERCRDSGYSLIIVDPLYKMLAGRNENAAGEMAEFLNELDTLAKDTGAAVVFAHHFAKGSAASKEQIDRTSGSGVFSRHPDGIITLTQHEREDSCVAEATLRNFPPCPPFALRWDFPVMRRDDSLDPTRLKAQAGRKTQNSNDDMLGLLVDDMTTAEWKAQALKERGISKSTFYELLKSIQTNGRAVSNTDDGEKRWRHSGNSAVRVTFGRN